MPQKTILETLKPMGWLGNHGYQLTTKTFNFNSSQPLTNFLLELLKMEHEIDDPTMEATENHHDLSVEITIDLGAHSRKSILDLAKHIENIFSNIN